MVDELSDEEICGMGYKRVSREEETEEACLSRTQSVDMKNDDSDIITVNNCQDRNIPLGYAVDVEPSYVYCTNCDKLLVFFPPLQSDNQNSALNRKYAWDLEQRLQHCINCSKDVHSRRLRRFRRDSAAKRRHADPFREQFTCPSGDRGCCLHHSEPEQEFENTNPDFSGPRKRLSTNVNGVVAESNSKTLRFGINWPMSSEIFYNIISLATGLPSTCFESILKPFLLIVTLFKFLYIVWVSTKGMIKNELNDLIYKDFLEFPEVLPETPAVEFQESHNMRIKNPLKLGLCDCDYKRNYSKNLASQKHCREKARHLRVQTNLVQDGKMSAGFINPEKKGFYDRTPGLHNLDLTYGQAREKIIHKGETPVVNEPIVQSSNNISPTASGILVQKHSAAAAKTTQDCETQTDEYQYLANYVNNSKHSGMDNNRGNLTQKSSDVVILTGLSQEAIKQQSGNKFCIKRPKDKKNQSGEIMAVTNRVSKRNDQDEGKFENKECYEKEKCVQSDKLSKEGRPENSLAMLFSMFNAKDINKVLSLKKEPKLKHAKTNKPSPSQTLSSLPNSEKALYENVPNDIKQEKLQEQESNTGGRKDDKITVENRPGNPLAMLLSLSPGKDALTNVLFSKSKSKFKHTNKPFDLILSENMQETSTETRKNNDSFAPLDTECLTNLKHYPEQRGEHGNILATKGQQNQAMSTKEQSLPLVEGPKSFGGSNQTKKTALSIKSIGYKYEESESIEVIPANYVWTEKNKFRKRKLPSHLKRIKLKPKFAPNLMPIFSDSESSASDERITAQQKPADEARKRTLHIFNGWKQKIGSAFKHMEDIPRTDLNIEQDVGNCSGSHLATDSKDGNNEEIVQLPAGHVKKVVNKFLSLEASN